MSLKYQPVALEEEKPCLSAYDSSTTLNEIECTLQNEFKGTRTTDSEWQRRRLRLSWIWLVHAVLLLTSCTIFSLAATIRSSTLKHVREFSAYSPAASSVEYQSVKFNVTTKENPFVGAGPEVDKAWRAISYDAGDQWVSSAELLKLDMPKTSLKVDHPKTGEKGYRVGLEVFHQLHCINLLRRVTYRDYYEPLGGEFAAGQEALQMHTDHCLEILRLNTQCRSDVGLFTFYMIPGDPLAWPELNSWHKCRNFDRVLDWANDNSVGNMEVLSSSSSSLSPQ